MIKNTVIIDTSTSPAKIEFAPEFNVAVPFIDRHLDEGRKEKIIIHTTSGEEVTYGQLSKRVNQAGNLLKNMGLNSGDRLLMVVKDSPEFFYLFWGAIKAGFIPVPLNTLFRSNDYAYIIEDSECTAIFYSQEFKTEVESALSQVSRSPDHSCLTEGVSGSFLEQLQSASLELDAAPSSATDDCFWL